MTRAIAHRGPDGEGIWRDEVAGIALGSRRLAIIDLSPAGAQPMQSADGRLVIAFNGEIYNHAELRAELEAQGRAPPGGWRGHCDTETFIEAIAAWGLGPALDRAAGMFAFALWDRREGVLRLVRDRFGEKPLYYGWSGKTLLFGSELKALRAHPTFDAAIEPRAVERFMARGTIPDPLSIYRGVFKLPPATILTIESDATPSSRPPVEGEWSDGVGLKRYWSYADLLGGAERIEDEEEALGELEALLAAAVERQSYADVPVGAFLSGGIDSSLICALYQKYASSPVRTFTIGFTERAYNEADDARAVARHLGTDHHELIVSPADARNVIPRLADIYDEPFADYSQIPTYLVSAFARSEVTVALTGDGGDELFGGYNRYAGLARAWDLKERAPRLVGGAAAIVGRLPSALVGGAASAMRRRRLPKAFGDKATRALRTLGGASDLEGYAAEFLDLWPSGALPLRGRTAGERDAARPGDARGLRSAQRLMLDDIGDYLPNDILVKVDRATMAVGLESHAPFLDPDVAVFSARLPMEMKVRRSKGKWLLRRLLSRELPAALVERPKAGFTLPLAEWLRGPLRDWADDLLDPLSLERGGVIDPTVVAPVWRAHREGRQDSSAALWAVLMFAEWQRKWM